MTVGTVLVMATRRTCVLFAIVVAALVAGAGAPVATAQTVPYQEIPYNEDTRQKLTVARFVTAQPSAAAFREQVAWEAAIHALYRHNPGVSASQIRDTVAAARQEAERLKRLSTTRLTSWSEQMDVVISAFNAVAGDSRIKIVGQTAELLKKGYLAFSDAQSQAAFEDLKRSVGNDMVSNQVSDFEATLYIAGLVAFASEPGNEEYSLWRTAISNVGFLDSIDALRASDPVVEIGLGVEEIRRLMHKQHASTTERLSDIDGALNIITGQISAVSEESRAALAAVNEKLATVVGWVESEQDRRTREQAAAERAERVAGLRSAVSLLSMVVNEVDPDLAWRVDAVGNASITVFETIEGLVAAGAAPGPFGALIAASSLASAGMQLIGAITGEAPRSETDILMEGITRIREDVHQLRTEMHDRFDRIELALNSAYDQILAQFDRIDANLGRVSSEVIAARNALVGALNQVEAGVYEAIITVGRRDLVEHVNRAAQRETLDRPSALQIENALFSWAHDHATDAASVPIDRSLAPEHWLAELRKHPLDRNLGYLGRVAGTVAGVNPVSDRVANPVDWALAARSYAALVTERQDLLPPNDATLTRLGRLMLVGETLQASQAGFAKRTAGRSVIDVAVAHYRQRLDELFARIDELRRDQERERGIPMFERPAAIMAGGGQDGTEDFFQTDRIPACDGSPFAISIRPEQRAPFAESMFPQAPRALRFGSSFLPRLSYCYDAKWSPFIRHTRRLVTSIHGRYTVEGTTTHTSTRDIFVTHGMGSRNPVEVAAEDPTTQHGLTASSASPLGSPRATTTIVPGPDLTVRTEQYLNELLRRERERFYHAIDVAAQPDGELDLRVRRLSAAKGFLEAALHMGLPRTVLTDDRLRAGLYGSLRLVDDEPSASIRPSGAQAPQYDVRRISRFWRSLSAAEPADSISRLRVDGYRRLADFERAVDEALDDLQQRGATETSVLVANTLAELRLARTILTAGPPPPPPPPPLRDTVRPVAKVSVAGKLPSAIPVRAGLRVRVRCSEPANVTATLTIRRRTARSLKLRLPRRGDVTLVRARGACSPARPVILRITPSRKYHSALRRARRAWSGTLTVHLTDTAGNQGQVSRTVRVGRR